MAQDGRDAGVLCALRVDCTGEGPGIVGPVEEVTGFCGIGDGSVGLVVHDVGPTASRTTGISCGFCGY